MYVKLFASLYQGTLRGRADEILVFTNLLAHADQHGVVDKHWKAIADETGLDKDRVEAAIKNLESPDAESRSPEMGGCRIVRLDEHRAWGWQIVNYGKYRAIRNEDDRREQNRIAQEKWRNKQHKPRSSNAEADTDTEADTEASYKAVSYVPIDTVVGESQAIPTTTAKEKNEIPYEKIVALYHETLSELPKVAKLTKQRYGYIRQRWLEDLPDLSAWEGYFRVVRKSKFLMGKSNGSGGRPPFRADLTWLCRPENIVKVIEGKYHG